MLIATREYKSKTFKSLILETVDDVLLYAQLNAQIKSRQAIGFWIGFKSQNFRATPLGYVAHEVDSGNTMAQVLATKITLKNEPTSLVEYCNISDGIINDIHNSMIRFVMSDNLVSVNSVGGYCPIQDTSEYLTTAKINEKQLYNFLLFGDIDADLKITAETIVIENDNYMPEELINQFCSKTGVDRLDIQVINSFKHKTLLFKAEDYLNLFHEGITAKGLRNIVFETTAQDLHQISGLKQVFEKVAQMNRSHTLKIYIKTYSRNEDLFKTDAPNIKIIFL